MINVKATYCHNIVKDMTDFADPNLTDIKLQKDSCTLNLQFVTVAKKERKVHLSLTQIINTFLTLMGFIMFMVVATA